MTRKVPAIPAPLRRPASPAGLLGLILAVAWGVQLWRPPLAYPESGRGLVLVVGLLAVAALLVRLRSAAEWPAPVRWSAAAAGAFCGYAWLRWMAGGFAQVGADNVATPALALVGGLTAHHLACSFREERGETGHAAGGWLVALAAGGLLCGLHAIAQRFYLYDRMLAETLQQIGASEPTPVQLGLIHHFRIKRVAGVWGDPNALGCFLVMGTVAAAGLAFASGEWRRWSLPMALPAIPVAVAGIWFTGSRGSILDGCIVLVVVVLARRMAPRNPVAGAALILAAVIALFCLHGRSHAAETTAPATPAPSGFQAMLSRSDTIRERANYARVGWQVFLANPVFGAGPGAVDLYYGRFKPAEARESKYLHNWPLQVLAEFGLVGLVAALAAVAGVLGAAWRALRGRDPWLAALGAVVMVPVIDGLYQLTFNQRELMLTFGITAGFLLALAPNPKASAYHLPRIGASVLTLVAVLLAVHATLPGLMVKSWMNAADLDLEEGNMPAARARLEWARRVAPRDPAPVAMMAQIAGLEGRRDDAVRLFEASVRIQPQSASLRMQLSRGYLAAGRPADAESAAREALRLYPTNAEYHYDLARILERRGDLAGAVAAANRAAELGFLYADRYRGYAAELEARRTKEGRP